MYPVTQTKWESVEHDEWHLPMLNDLCASALAKATNNSVRFRTHEEGKAGTISQHGDVAVLGLEGRCSGFFESLYYEGRHVGCRPAPAPAPDPAPAPSPALAQAPGQARFPGALAKAVSRSWPKKFHRLLELEAKRRAFGSDTDSVPLNPIVECIIFTRSERTASLMEEFLKGNIGGKRCCVRATADNSTQHELLSQYRFVVVGPRLLHTHGHSLRLPADAVYVMEPYASIWECRQILSTIRCLETNKKYLARVVPVTQLYCVCPTTRGSAPVDHSPPLSPEEYLTRVHASQAICGKRLYLAGRRVQLALQKKL
jgi:hypothetical protein